MKRFVYFYFNKQEPEKVRGIVPAHVQYWKSANLPGYSGGPFADRTGGMISFLAPDDRTAEKITNEDPFVVEDCIDGKWLKEWLVE
jgi:uncharacterized protein YciI